ncbi:MAG: hypothetical protein OJF52_004499 [Nitrospira sp.]|nr:MAG: hypothetical protein OJF52_004499 [Nitrospira sp.]
MIRLSAQTSVAVAVGIAWVYLALALVAPGCSFAHPAPSSSHHQHSGTESHSTLCSWACQAISDAGPVSHGEGGRVWAAQYQAFSTSPFLLTSLDYFSLYGRAPPIPARGEFWRGAHRRGFSSQLKICSASAPGL